MDCGVLGSGDELKLGEVFVSTHLAVADDSEQSGGTLHGHERFTAILRDELYRSKQFNRPLTLMLVQANLRGDGPVSSWIHRLRGVLRPIDHMALYAPNIVELLFPEMPIKQAKDVANQITRKGGLRCGISGYPGSAATVDRLLGGSLESLQRTDQERPIHITESTGVRTWDTDAVTDDSLPIVASPVMKELYRTVDQIAQGRVPVLIFGETGTGKELVARALHDRGPRSKARLCSVNCGAIPGSLVESTLFGYEKGAFTGADRSTPGVFEEADGGTVFLDEIGELPAAAQVALLRVLETKEIVRVGSSRERKVDVRIVAATHRNLEQMTEGNEFRQDLYYRLNAMVVHIPPLRERIEEIPHLARHFLRQAKASMNSDANDINMEALEMLCTYAWPGNVRELRNVIERAVVLATRDVITPDNLPQSIHVALEESTDPGSEEKEQRRRATGQFISDVPTNVIHVSELEEAPGVGFRERMAQLERQVLIEALNKNDWNQTAAAKDLELPLRTLVRKLNKLDIKKPSG